MCYRVYNVIYECVMQLTQERDRLEESQKNWDSKVHTYINMHSFIYLHSCIL